MRLSLQRFIEREQAVIHRLTLPAGSSWRWLAALGAHLGDGPLWAVVGAGLLIWGTPFLRALTWVTALAVLGSTGISTAIKYLVRRRRPQELTQFYASKHDRYSFPSGHATRMAAIAVIVGCFVPELALTSYALAPIVAICRVLVGVHYPSDVVAGILIGCVGAGLVLQWIGPTQP
jgi:undecaprenyl-diphosphatase